MALGASIYSRGTVLNDDLRPRKKKKKKPPAEQISQRGRQKELRENGIGRNPAVKVGRRTSILKRKPDAKSLITDGAGECISVTLYLNGAHVSIHRVPHYFAGRKVKAVINGVISRSAAAAAAATAAASLLRHCGAELYYL